MTRPFPVPTQHPAPWVPEIRPRAHGLATVLAAGALLGTSACGDKEMVIPSSFDVSIADWDMEAPPPGPTDYPDPLSFQLHLQPAEEDATEGNVILGTYGRAVAGSYTRAGDTLTLAFDELHVPVDYPTADCPANLHLLLDAIQVTAHDDDDDGRADRLTGTTAGRRGQLMGQILEYTNYQGQLQGVVDETPPRATLYYTGNRLDPDADIAIVFSEPIPADSVVTLTPDDGGEPIELSAEPIPGVPAVVTTFPYGEPPLALDTWYTVTVAGGLRDMAGNPGEEPLRSFLTWGDPGLFPEDGFENGNYIYAFDASIRDSIGLLDPIAGNFSLYVGGGGFVLMRVPVDAGDTRVRMRARILFTTAVSVPIDGVIRVVGASVDGQTNADLEGFRPAPGMEETRTESGNWVASPEFDLEVPLPGDAGDEVMVTIKTESEGPFCNVPFPPPVPEPFPGLWIDDLRAE